MLYRNLKRKTNHYRRLKQILAVFVEQSVGVENAFLRAYTAYYYAVSFNFGIQCRKARRF